MSESLLSQINQAINKFILNEKYNEKINKQNIEFLKDSYAKPLIGFKMNENQNFNDVTFVDHESQLAWEINLDYYDSDLMEDLADLFSLWSIVYITNAIKMKGNLNNLITELPTHLNKHTWNIYSAKVIIYHKFSDNFQPNLKSFKELVGLKEKFEIFDIHSFKIIAILKRIQTSNSDLQEYIKNNRQKIEEKSFKGDSRIYEEYQKARFIFDLLNNSELIKYLDEFYLYDNSVEFNDYLSELIKSVENQMPTPNLFFRVTIERDWATCKSLDLPNFNENQSNLQIKSINDLHYQKLQDRTYKKPSLSDVASNAEESKTKEANLTFKGKIKLEWFLNPNHAFPKVRFYSFVSNHHYAFDFFIYQNVIFDINLWVYEKRIDNSQRNEDWVWELQNKRESVVLYPDRDIYISELKTTLKIGTPVKCVQFRSSISEELNEYKRLFLISISNKLVEVDWQNSESDIDFSYEDFLQELFSFAWPGLSLHLMNFWCLTNERIQKIMKVFQNNEFEGSSAWDKYPFKSVLISSSHSKCKNLYKDHKEKAKLY